MNATTHATEGSAAAPVLYMALELSNRSWRLAFGDGAKLIRHHAGERGGWSVLRVPSIEEEDARHLHRELERLKRERLAHRVRMQSLLVTQGVRLTVKRALGLRLGGLTLWDGRHLPVELKAELERERRAPGPR